MSLRPRGRLGGVAGLVLALALLAGPDDAAAQGRQPVDLELLLAVDTSSSVAPDEFDLQMRGLAEAFRHPEVQAALRAAGDRGVAVALMQWSDNRKQTMAIDWQVLTHAASAEAFAQEIDNTPRFLIGGGTAIGGALQFALRQIETNRFEGVRKVIDVSGDGRTNQGITPGQIRDLVVAAGITINGLAILNEDSLVDRHYLAHVIGGTGAFVMRAQDYADFARAILEKLVKEIGGAPIAARPPFGRLAAAP